MTNGVAIRVAGWGIALALVLLPLVGLLGGWFAAARWPVRTLSVDAPFVHVSAATIRGAVTPLLIHGFFAVDPDVVQSRLAALPWVAAVEVRKVWPDQVEVHVHEQQAFARWNGSTLINRQGVVFKVPGPGDLSALPDLGGPDARRNDVLAFYLDSKQRFAKVGRTVIGARLSDRGAWQLLLDGGVPVVVGRGPVQQRLARFIDTYPRLMEGHPQGFQYVDLRYTNGYAVRWPAEATATGGQPKA